ncbi:MAG: D-hexose-6-phosphate mutarotase [Gammaproteobacteria bacterium]|nr:D-hexose-6-phosphate mutarotase [Gammaproteobacteria bacterium]NBT44422.1 D-hexose-6-phosphate mutarotase [Gammaproteobacteria bacterium]
MPKTTPLPILPDGLSLESQGSLQLLLRRNGACSFSLSLQGAQLLHWTPQGQSPVVWLSPDAKFLAGKSPRGGIPICWPWFGPHEQPNHPAHGVARASDWSLLEARRDESGNDFLRFRLLSSAELQALYPENVHLEVSYRLGAQLEVELTTLNQSSAPFELTEALHTYLGVGDISDISIDGLEATDFIDKVDQGSRHQQEGPIHIEGETDRVYLSTQASCSVRDPILKRRIVIDKEGSASTIVWNPWSEKAQSLGDLGNSGYRQMICVESGNALSNAIKVAPGNTHTLWVRYSCLPL